MKTKVVFEYRSETPKKPMHGAMIAALSMAPSRTKQLSLTALTSNKRIKIKFESTTEQ